MYALCVCKGLNVLLCSALSMQTKLTKQSNIKLYMQRLIKAMQRLYYVYVLLYALIDLYVYGFT